VFAHAEKAVFLASALLFHQLANVTPESFGHGRTLPRFVAARNVPVVLPVVLTNVLTNVQLLSFAAPYAARRAARCLSACRVLTSRVAAACLLPLIPTVGGSAIASEHRCP
jgi:hypothetical protein